MNEPKTKQIGAYTVKVAPFSAIKALGLKWDLMKLIGPSVGRMLGAVGNPGGGAVPGVISAIGDVALDGEQVGRSLEGLFSQLDSETFIRILKRILSNTTVQTEATGPNGKPGWLVQFPEGDVSSFETSMEIFSGNLLTIYQVMFFVLEVNYPDFFGLTAAIGEKFKTLFSRSAGDIEKD